SRAASSWPSSCRRPEGTRSRHRPSALVPHDHDEQERSIGSWCLPIGARRPLKSCLEIGDRRIGPKEPDGYGIRRVTVNRAAFRRVFCQPLHVGLLYLGAPAPPPARRQLPVRGLPIPHL